jgi:hypothetical protein
MDMATLFFDARAPKEKCVSEAFVTLELELRAKLGFLPTSKH